MTRNDVKNTLAYISFIFPDFKVPNEKIIKHTLDIWERALRGRSEEEVKEAIYLHYTSSKWTPHLSDLLAILNKNDRRGLPSENEMVYQTYEAMAGWSRYSDKDPLGEVHPLTKEAIKTYGGLEAISRGGLTGYNRNKYLEHCKTVLESHTNETVKGLLTTTKVRDAAEEALQWLEKDLEKRIGGTDAKDNLQIQD